VATTVGKVKRSIRFDADVLAWLEQRGAGLDRSVDWQVRQILRAAMDAERAKSEAA
jgi:uncharacterized protein (DUF4415 family)